jgi:hypothetical protein
MKNTNIGIANLVVSNKLKDSYFNNTLIEESKKLTTNFFDVVKSSPILQLEFKVFNNLENKTIENELIATRYIDIKLFEVYTIQEIDDAREKLGSFLTEESTKDETERVSLYNAIDTLITESLNDYDKIDVDAVHESFEIVLNHIKTPKTQTLVETTEHKQVAEEVIEIAVSKFNEKYESLNEDDKVLLKKLIKANKTEKTELLETYKTDCLTILEGVNKDESEDKKSKIANAIRKIREMKYNKNSINDDIIGLHEFKKELL